MKRVLLTGAGGFIGRNCLRPLLEAGFDLHAAGRSPLSDDIGITFHTMDLLDPAARFEVLSQVQPTHLVHAAWDLRVENYMSSAHNYQWASASLDFTREFAQCNGERALFIGSCYEYDWASPILDDRSTPLEPQTHYGKAKAGLFRLVLDYAQAAGISVAWSRLFFLYGPFEARRRLVPSVITSLLLGHEAPTSHGRQERDYMYSADVGRALVALLDSRVDGPVNIGTGTAISVAALVKAAAERCGRPELLRIGAIESRPGESPRVQATTDRLRTEVGWADYTPMDTALGATVEWWKRQIQA